MKILYISEDLSIPSGGTVGNKRNQTMLINYFGKKNVILRYFKAESIFPVRKVWNEIRYRNFYGINKREIKSILNDIETQKIELIWLDNSNLGYLAKIIKTQFKNIKVITFFHNVEYYFMKDQWRITHKPKFIYRQYISKINEQDSCIYSDKIVCYNNRDANIIQSLYGRIVDFLIPISLANDNEPTPRSTTNNEIKALFLGSNFPPNIEGICLFIEHVLPYTDINLIVAGSGMECLKKLYPNTKRLHIMGFVENLQELYSSINFMVMPIFSGSGMKIKTAEALKYGKYIFASPEAVEGYNTTINEVCICDNLNAFIQNINDKGKLVNAYNESSRDLFLKYYCHKASSESFSNLFLSMGL